MYLKNTAYVGNYGVDFGLVKVHHHTFRRDTQRLILVSKCRNKRFKVRGIYSVKGHSLRVCSKRAYDRFHFIRHNGQIKSDKTNSSFRKAQSFRCVPARQISTGMITGCLYQGTHRAVFGFNHQRIAKQYVRVCHALQHFIFFDSQSTDNCGRIRDIGLCHKANGCLCRLEYRIGSHLCVMVGCNIHRI